MTKYSTKNQRIYREPEITDKLRLNLNWHEAIYHRQPQRMFVTKKILGEYMEFIGKNFAYIFYHYKNVATGKYPTYRGVELIPIK